MTKNLDDEDFVDLEGIRIHTSILTKKEAPKSRNYQIRQEVKYLWECIIKYIRKKYKSKPLKP